jgi:hypothetical protein
MRGAMHIFYLKSLLSLIVLLLSLVGVFTMFEIFGRTEKRYNIETLKKVHRANGVIYFFTALVIAYLCIDFLMKTKAEPSARAMFHAVFALAVLLILCMKVLVVRFYRQFYGKLQTAGIILAFVSFGMIGTSAGYFLLVTKFGSELPVKPSEQKKETVQAEESVIAKVDTESIGKGRELYESKCTFCHDPFSNRTIVGPGHKGILKNRVLPVSGRPAIPANIERQLRTPYKDMPSFSSLSDDDVQNIIAFLNTL